MRFYLLTTIFFLLFLSYFPLKGQDALSKGNYMIGGNIDFSFSNNKDDYSDNNIDNSSASNNDRENIYFLISPTIGKLIKDDLMIGTSLSIAKRSFKRDGMRYVNIKTGINIFVRKFWKLHNNFNIYLNPYFDYAHTNRNVSTKYAGSSFYRNTESEQYQNTFQLGTSFGAMYFINDHFSLSASLGNLYFYYSNTNNVATEQNNQGTTNSTRELSQHGVNFRVASSLSSLGINYFF